MPLFRRRKGAKMAVAVTLTLDNPTPNHGDTVTATYAVSGNTAVDAHDTAVDGDATIGTTDFPVTATVTIPATVVESETFAVPVCAELTFVATADPAVFTALVP